MNNKSITLRFRYDENVFTLMTVKCSLKVYDDDKEFFYLKYGYIFSPGNEILQLGHPLSGTEHADNDGVIVSANSVTRSLLDCLFAEDLPADFCGYHSNQQYKKNVLQALALLWA